MLRGKTFFFRFSDDPVYPVYSDYFLDFKLVIDRVIYFR